MNRLGKTLEAFLISSNTKRRIIVSTYNSHEWIQTYNCRSMFLLKIAYHLMGYRVYGNVNTQDVSLNGLTLIKTKLHTTHHITTYKL